ncbi:MAG: sulfite exporter TauE/SafE family protein, partial [Deltaproteobacteria bacterium]|nr:sulfite exporter TauE/SafE family protein [Deltaproteobacteria bacterium]
GVQLRIGFAAAIGALGGSALGTRIALAVSEETIRTVVLVLVPTVLVLFLAKDRLLGLRTTPHDPGPDHAPSNHDAGPGPCQVLAIPLLLGLVVGTYDGFFGPGTGTFLALGFHLWTRLDLTTASGNARLANLASNAGSLVVFLVAGKVLFPLALVTAVAGVTGNVLGAGLAVRRGERVIRPLMVFVLLLLLGEVVRQQMS